MSRPLTFLVWTALAFVPAVKADFIYDFRETSSSASHIEFTLPTFQQAIDDITTFDVATTLFISPITHFSVSGGGAKCSGAPSILFGPCWVIAYQNGSVEYASGGAAFLFSGPGTYSSPSGTLSIREVSGVPEPSAWVLLASAVGIVGVIARKRRSTHRDAEGRETRSVSLPTCEAGALTN